MHCGSFSRRKFLRTTSTILAAPAVLNLDAWAKGSGRTLRVDACVYGGTSGGVIAAVALARRGRSVALVEPSRHLGGMTTGGLGWVDIETGAGGLRAFGGLAGEYYRRVREYYAARGVDVRKFGNDGAVAEPHVAELVLEQMLAEQSRHVTILRENRLASVHKEGRRIRKIQLDQAPVDGRGAPTPEPLQRHGVSISAAFFIDASYEGDLMAAAGVSHRVDRENRAEYGESYAGVYPERFTAKSWSAAIDPYQRRGDPSSGLIPLISQEPLGTPGSASRAMQAYNFRMCLVKDHFIPIEPGPNYDPGTYEIVARMLAAEAAAKTPVRAWEMHRTGTARLLRFEAMPNGKTDVNNAGSISTDFVTGGSEKYAAGSWADRARLWHAHEDYQRGLYHFLATDHRVSEDIRDDLRRWGLARDEFQDTRGWPTQLYIRESRRMVGNFVMRQSDCEGRSPKLTDAVGVGHYSLDSHISRRVNVNGHVVHEGGFYGRIPGAFPIPYRVLTPRADECENLMVTFCVSVTHVCFGSIRMEAPFMVLSESAAIATHRALEEGVSVQSLDTARLSRHLRDAGQVLSPAEV